MKKNKILLVVLSCIYFNWLGVEISLSETENNCFELCPWRIGQFVEYQILSLENLSQENRYKVSIVGKEFYEDSTCFWIILDVFNGHKREISFKALVKPLDSTNFSERPDLYISEGMFLLLRNAQRLIIIIDDGSSYEVSPSEFFNAPDILAGTLYKNTPDEKNCVDYTKMKFLKETEKISVPAGIFDCYHFWVKTTEYDSFTDEGFDLWRSPKVPFLGVVKLEFSKTEYLKKWNHHYSQIMNTDNWLSKLYVLFFLRRVPGRERNDTYTIKLIDYGQN